VSGTPSAGAPSVLGLDVGAATRVSDDGWVVRDFRAAEGLDGPPGILQGGLSAGLVLLAGRLLAGTAAPRCGFSVRLHAPTPLGRDLQVRARATGAGRYEVETCDGSDLLVAGTVVLDDPEPAPETAPLLELARVPVPRPEPQPGFPTCWVCGADAVHPHAQRLVPGWHDARSVVNRWEPDEALSDGSGFVDPLVVSAVLDCPSVWAARDQVQGRGYAGALLAGYELRFLKPAPVEQRLRTVGHCDEVDGRKVRARGALLDDDGTLYAVAAALHIAVGEMPTQTP
jgi:acyl dehydratase